MGIIFDVRDRKTGEAFQCTPQMVDLNFDGKYVLRYNIGIFGYVNWTPIVCCYDNDVFNERYEVLGKHKASGLG